ncbi:hypothetical protein D915_001629 [Fasciola hepatica]|uniref:Uncharacterized protein n=1 Tax=Fasciola hepatica TaxID=6192 RepID=A0A4E0RLQ5_FASHE|nr:hypothetical protein D915_001629 [Fasciola hepatica]
MLNFFIVNWRRASSPVMGLALCQSLNTFISTVIRRSKTSVSGLPEEQPSMYQRTAESGSLLSRLGASPKLSVTSNPTDLRSAFASELDNVITCLFQHLFQIAQRQISVENSGYIETYTKVLREIKRAFATLGSSYPDRIWSAVQSHLTNGSELSRAVTVDLLRHLVSAGPSSPDRSPFSKSTQQQILNSVLRLLFGSGVPLPGFQRVSNSVISGATTTASAMAMTAPNRRSSLRHSLMGDVVHGAPLGPDRDSLLLGEIVSGENVAPLIRVELIKLVLTLGSLGYLDLEGGHILVEFVVRQCALTQTSLIAHDKISVQHVVRGVGPVFNWRNGTDLETMHLDVVAFDRSKYFKSTRLRQLETINTRKTQTKAKQILQESTIGDDDWVTLKLHQRVAFDRLSRPFDCKCRLLVQFDFTNMVGSLAETTQTSCTPSESSLKTSRSSF